MANIYLRLPVMVCCYHRNYDPDHKLTPFMPLKFSTYTDHAVVLRGGLSVFTGKDQKAGVCYSQAQWNNMLRGRRPDGSQLVMVRDPSSWLTYTEICNLEGRKLSHKTDSYDYLCIQMPKTVLVGDREMRTNASFSLAPNMASLLRNLLEDDFKRALLQWVVDTKDFCLNPTRIIDRTHAATLERFLMRFDIPVTQDGKEKDTIRRLLQRWLESAGSASGAYKAYDEDITYEDPKDRVRKINNPYK